MKLKKQHFVDAVPRRIPPRPPITASMTVELLDDGTVVLRCSSLDGLHHFLSKAAEATTKLPVGSPLLHGDAFLKHYLGIES
jgi:hypothetical protein